MKTVAFVLTAILCIAPAFAADPILKEPARVMRVISGDTLTVLYQGK
jgi:endonuclease YncB( thermonuclease family)